MRKLVLLVLLTFSLLAYASDPVIVAMNDGNCYARLSADKTQLLKGNYKTGKEEILVEFSKMRNIQLDLVRAFRFSPDESRILLKKRNRDYYVYNFSSRRCDKLSTKGDQSLPIFSPDGTMIAFVRDNDLYLKRLLFNSEVRITNDGSSEVLNGVRSESVKQAFNAGVGFVFSKDNEVLAYAKNHQLYLYNVQYKWNKQVQLSNPNDIYISHLQWTNNAETFAVMYLNHTQTELNIDMVNEKTLIAKNVYKNKEDQYISPENACFIQFFPDNDNFGVLEEKDGYNHMHLYNAQGRYIRQLGEGDFDVTKIYGYNQKTKEIFYQSTENGTLNRGVYAKNLKNGKKRAIAIEDGTSDAVFSSNFKYLELIYSSMNTPHIYSIAEADGDIIRVLHSDSAKVKYEKEFFKYAENTYGWLLRKPGVRNAPLILNVTDARNQWQMDISYSLVEQGYIVASVAASGSEGLGEKYKKAIYGDIFQAPARDYIKVAKYLVKEGYADLRNIFMMGNRVAGGVVLAALIENKTPISGGIVISPISDLLTYNPIITERVMRTEGVLPGFDKNSAVKNAKNIKGKLLIVHAMNDGTNAVENTNRLIEALVDANVQFEMQLYPRRDESFTASLLQPHLFSRILLFLKNNIKN